MEFDLEAPGTSKKHPDGVYIYAMNHAPGFFFDRQGNPVSVERGEEAGFDIRILSAQRRQSEKLEEFRAKMAEEERRIISGEALDDAPDPQVDAADSIPEGFTVTSTGELRETPNLKTVHLGGGLWNIVSKSDDSAVASRIKREEMVSILEQDRGKTLAGSIDAA